MDIKVFDLPVDYTKLKPMINNMDIKEFDLPVDYSKLKPIEKTQVRKQYIKEQDGKCIYCGGDLESPPPMDILSIKINWKLFPPGFLNSPIHLQHSHKTGMTEGAVHAYCNAVLWQYEGK